MVNLGRCHRQSPQPSCGSPAQPLLTMRVSGKSTKELQRLCTHKMGKAGKSGLSRLPEEERREYGKRKGRGEEGLEKGQDGKGRVSQAE